MVKQKETKEKENKDSEEKKVTTNRPENPVPVSDFLILTSSTLITKAWAYLGVVSHPETGKIKKDLRQAELAIDAIDSISNLLKAFGENTKDLEFQLSNLRLNYLSAKDSNTDKPGK